MNISFTEITGSFQHTVNKVLHQKQICLPNNCYFSMNQDYRHGHSRRLQVFIVP